MGDPFFLGWPLLAVETRVVGGPSVTYPVLIGLTLAVSRARPFPATQSRGTLDRLESDGDQWLLWQTEEEVSHVLKG